MPRPPRIQYPGAWYHVMNRGASRSDIFRQTTDRLVFLELLDLACSRTRAEVHAYCLMTNHFHLVMRTPDPNLDEMMKSLCEGYSRYFNDKYDRDGRLCRDRYRAILVESERYLLAVSRYVHRNPLAFWKRPLESYPWSSYGAYLGQRRSPYWLETDETLQLAGGRDRYRALVTSPLQSEVDKLHQGGSRLPSVLGAADFRSRVAEISGHA